MGKDDSDCYYYFNSTCTKGDECGFRHCEAALGSETVCSFWKSGSCARPECKYRHTDARIDRSRTICFFESQPAGCQKPSCTFRHRSQIRSGCSENGSATNGDAAQPVSPASVRDSASNSSADQTSAENSEPGADPLPAVPVEPVSFHVVNEDESDPEDEKKQESGTRPQDGDGIVVKSLEQIRMERLFKQQGDSSSVPSHKRQSTGEDAGRECSSVKRVRLVRPKTSDPQPEPGKGRAASLTDDLTALLDGDCDQSTASDKDDDILQEIDKIINS